MTPERFIELADAWGADLQRWPAHERAAAQALVAQRRPELLRALDTADELDCLLAAHAIDAPDAALLQRVVASAPAARPRSATRWWWWGAGAAGVGLAGAVAGAAAASLALPLLLPVSRGTADLAYAATAFGVAVHERSDE